MAALAGCSGPKGDMSATFYDMSASKFSVQAIAPTTVIREYAICKAVWFAEKKRAETISLCNPSYAPTDRAGPMPPIPVGWTVLNSTAYVGQPSADGNPTVPVAEKAALCRQGWDWYR
jgi:hypothetical protein